MTEENKEIIAYKGFSRDWKCRGYQYEIGKTYEHEGKVEACESGFHSCENPLDVLAYYDISSGSKYAIVKASGEISRNDNRDTKIASSKITIEVELNIHELLKAGFEWVMNKIFAKHKQALNDQSTAAASGNQSTAATSGDQSTAATSGNQSTAATSGNQSTAATSGYLSTAATSGYLSTAATSGNQSTAATSGNLSTAIASGKNSVAIAFGSEAKSKAVDGSAIVCCYFDNSGELIHIRASKVGKNGIKPDTWYTLNEDGEFIEVNDERD